MHPDSSPSVLVNFPGQRPLPRVRYELCCEAAPALLWQVRRIALDEALSRCYELSVEVLVADTELDVDALLGSSCELRVDREGVVRTVCGVVDRIECRDRSEDAQPVRLVVVPALRLLAQRVDTRLWQGMSAIAVATEVLSAALAEYGRELDTGRLHRSYSPREYVVQYDESDLDFAARLLEDEGVTFHFDHERGTGREVLVLEDSADHWAEIPTLDDNPSLHVIASRADEAEVESVQRLTWARATRPSAVARRGFDWLGPRTPISAAREAKGGVGPQRERYHHGGPVENDPELRIAHDLARARAGARMLRGASNVIGLAPGRRVRLAAADRPELEHDEFLVTRVCSRGDCPELELGAATGEAEYTNEFECVVCDGEPWRPPLRTPRPKVYGPQTALVTGPEGEEIHTDEHGRVKVLFHWDRQHTHSDDSSVWIRVAQAWAGAGFGVHFIPRVGMEVVVEFINGDPDRPLVTGCVYNGDATSSVALPDAKTRSTIRTRSSPGGEGFNELRFEDAAGGEEIFVHAQRDLRETVRRNHTNRVGNDRCETIGGDHRQTIHGAQTLVIDGTRTETVRADEEVIHEKSRTTTVYGEELLEVFDRTTAIHHNSLERRIFAAAETHVFAPEGGIARAHLEVEGDLDQRIKNAATLTAGDRIALVQGAPAGRVRAEFADGTLELDAEQDWRGSAGAKAELHAGACLELEGGTRAQLRQGGAAIRLEQDKILMEAAEVRIRVGTNEFVLSESGLTVETAAIDMSALALVAIKGAMVKID